MDFTDSTAIKDHKGPYTSSEVDSGGHDPNPNHVNESLLSEVDWGAHNPDADDPEQLTGESIQSDRIPSTTPGAEPPRDARDSGSARSHSTHLETSSSDRP